MVSPSLSLSSGKLRGLAVAIFVPIVGPLYPFFWETELTANRASRTWHITISNGSQDNRLATSGYSVASLHKRQERTGVGSLKVLKDKIKLSIPRTDEIMFTILTISCHQMNVIARDTAFKNVYGHLPLIFERNIFKDGKTLPLDQDDITNQDWRI